jgi:lysophospholipase L1-like esterase
MRQRSIVRAGLGAKVPLGAVASLLALTGTAQAGSAAEHHVAAHHKKATHTYYVSLGDSYSVGYQPGPGATAGYTGYVARKTHLRLVNFGCGDATTSSIIDTTGCPDNLPHTAGAVLYPDTTQTAAAEAFITAHRGHIGLITVSIGGNDVTSCATQANLISCVGTAVSGITQNVTSLAMALRVAAGPKVPLIGSTYPDVFLGDYVFPSLPVTPVRISLAHETVVAFRSLINPALVKAYAAGQGVLVDVTAASGAYLSLTTTTDVQPYGSIPIAVAKVCSLTWFCQEGNIHATTKGYTLIGQLIVARYARLRRS